MSAVTVYPEAFIILIHLPEIVCNTIIHFMARLKLIGSRIVIRPLPQPTCSGGILLAQKYQDDRTRFEVLDVGPKAKDIKIGDNVLVDSNCENLFEWNDKVQVIDSSAVIAVF